MAAGDRGSAWKRGDTVRVDVDGGAYAGLVATVDKIDSRGRIEVLLGIIRHTLPADIVVAAWRGSIIRAEPTIQSGADFRFEAAWLPSACSQASGGAEIRRVVQTAFRDRHLVIHLISLRKCQVNLLERLDVDVGRRLIAMLGHVALPGFVLIARSAFLVSI